MNLLFYYFSKTKLQGIATYSQAGAQYGYNLLWSILFTYPFMVAAQLICARIGRITGIGLAGNIKSLYNSWILFLVVTLLFIANVINIAADLRAMGEAMQLLTNFGSIPVYTTIFSSVCLALQLFLPYHTYVGYLKYLTLALMSYIITGFTINISWWEVLQYTVFPDFTFTRESTALLVAVVGTTISPYMFFWYIIIFNYTYL